MSWRRAFDLGRWLLVCALVALGFAGSALGASDPAAGVDRLHAQVNRLIAAHRSTDALRTAIAERDLAKKTFGEQNERSARASIDVGVTSEASGHTADAEEAYRNGIIAESSLVRGKKPADYREIVEDLHDYGSFLVFQSRFNEAEFYLDGAAGFASKMKPFDAALAIPVLIAYASVEVQLGKFSVASDLANDVLSGWKRSHLSPDIDVRNAYIILGQIADAKRDYATSEAYYDKALAIRLAGDDASPLYGALQAAIGQVDLDDATFGGHPSKVDAAERHFTTALAICRRTNAAYLDTSYVQEQLAEVYGVRKQYDRSLTAFEAILKNMRSVFDERFTYMSENDRLAFQSGTQEAFRQFYVVAWDAQVTSGRDTFGQMFDIALWQKGLVLRSIESLRTQLATLRDPSLDRLFGSIQGARTRIADASISKQHDPAALFSNVDSLNYQEQQLARELSGRGVRSDTITPTWQQIAGKLGPDEAAVEFVDTGQSYMALVLTHDSHSVVLLGNEERISSDAVKAYRAEFGFIPSAGNESFYDIAWKPLLSRLAGITRVYVATDGALDQIPLDAVADDDGKLLMQDYDIRRVASTGVLVEPAASSIATTAFLLGDPQYYPNQIDGGTCADEVAASRSAPLRGRQIDTLPCTRVEVDKAAAALEAHGLSVTTEIGDGASESLLDGLHGPRIVHIATHGFFFADAAQDQRSRFATGGAAAYEDPLMRSGLILAGGGATWQGLPPSAAKSDDGILTAYEAADLDLHGTELVVLSACDSGLGETTSGEGVFGLQRAFAEAGTKMLMMSMWDVPDLETQELLQTFYEKWLGGLDAFAALHAAELQERDVVRQRYGHDVPKDWAGFMLVMN